MPRPTDTPKEEPKIRGYARIAALLSELFGDTFSTDAIYRLSTRRTRPLPVDGPERRVYTTRSALEAWVAAERQRRGRTPSTIPRDQLGLFDK